MSTQITLFANRKTNEKQPDYRASYKDQHGEWHNVASVWVKQGAKGQYLSLSLEESELEGYQANQNNFRKSTPVAQPTIDPEQVTIDEAISSDDFPFNLWNYRNISYSLKELSLL